MSELILHVCRTCGATYDVEGGLLLHGSITRTGRHEPVCSARCADRIKEPQPEEEA